MEGDQALDSVNRSPARVHVIDTYGRLGTMDPTDAKAAVENGDARLPTPDELQGIQDKEQYGSGALNPVIAGAESAASTMTLGGSRHLENLSGLTTPEAQAARAKYNPVASGIVGPAVGIGGLIAGSLTGGSEAAGAAGAAAEGAGEAAGLSAADLLPGRLAMRAGQAVSKAASPLARSAAGLVANPESLPIVNKILARAGSAALGSAAEGAFFGLGQAVDERALGDPDAMGEKLLPHIGFGALIGGGAGAFFGALHGGYEGYKGFNNAKEVPSTVSPSDGSAPAAPGVTQDGVGPAGPPPSGLEPGPDAPGSIPEIAARVKGAAYQGMKTELPAKAELEAAVNAVPDLEFKPHAIQMASLDNQGARDLYKTGMEMQTPESQAMRNYEAIQKQETLGKTNLAIKSVAGPGLTDDSVQGGNRIIKAFSDQYEAENKAVAPVFDKFSKTAIVPTDPWEIVGKVEDAIPGAKRFLTIGEDGKFEIAPYTKKMPFTENVWGDIQDVLDAANDKKLTLDDLRNIRGNLGSHIHLESGDLDKIHVSKLKKGLMDYLQDSVQKLEPDVELRDAFRRYAINQEKRTTIEYTLGGKIAENSPLKRKIIPEDVLKNIFSDTPTVKASREILGDQTFNEALGNFLNSKVVDATDKGSFSSNKFGRFLKQKWPELEEAFRDNPQVLKRLKALNDIMRILPDSAPINPSQTAKTLNIMSMLHKVGGLVAHPTKIIGEGIEHFAEKQERANTYAQLNALLAGKSASEAAQVSRMADLAGKIMGEGQGTGEARALQMGKMERLVQKTSTLIRGGAKSIFQGPKPGTVPVATTLLSPKDHGKLQDDLTAMTGNPEKFIDQLDSSTRGLYGVAPKTASSLQQAAARAAQFLNTKLPTTPPKSPFGPAFKPSQAELSKFGKYHAVIENPVSVLQQVKTGALTPEHMEALGAVYPKLLEEMRATVMDELTNHLSKKKDLPYKTRVALSNFLGQDLDHSTEGQTIAGNQTALNQLGQGPTPQAAQAQGALKVHQSGLAHISTSQRMLTSQQSNSQREA